MTQLSIEQSRMNKLEIIIIITLLLGLGVSTVFLVISVTNFDILIRDHGFFFVFLIFTGLGIVLNAIIKELYGRSLMKTIHVLFLTETPIAIPISCIAVLGLLFYSFMLLPPGSLEEMNGMYYHNVQGYREEISYTEYHEGELAVRFFFFNLCGLFYLYALGIYWKTIFGKGK